MTTALASLYNSTKGRPLAGNVGGLARVQEVLTPTWILDAVREAFGGPIGLDPCASTNPANWFAEANLCLPPEAGVLQAAINAAEGTRESAGLKRQLQEYTLGGSLRENWDIPDAFINPHFDTLQPWMAKVKAESDRTGGYRTVLLCPVRTQRSWWPKLAAGARGVWLAPFSFVGHKSAFPAGLCLLARGCEIPPLGKAETGRFSW